MKYLVMVASDLENSGYECSGLAVKLTRQTCQGLSACLADIRRMKSPVLSVSIPLNPSDILVLADADRFVGDDDLLAESLYAILDETETLTGFSVLADIVCAEAVFHLDGPKWIEFVVQIDAFRCQPTLSSFTRPALDDDDVVMDMVRDCHEAILREPFPDGIEARLVWTPDDISSVREDWPDTVTERALSMAVKALVDRGCEQGNGILDDILPGDPSEVGLSSCYLSTCPACGVASHFLADSCNECGNRELVRGATPEAADRLAARAMAAGTPVFVGEGADGRWMFDPESFDFLIEKR